MKKINSIELIDRLSADLQSIIQQTEQMLQQPEGILSRQPAPGSWSVAQVIAHLNFYCRFYVPAFEDALHFHQTKAQEFFKPGWLGDYFTSMMRPEPDQTIRHKMKAPANALPPAKVEPIAELRSFISNQHRLLSLLESAKLADLNRLSVPISLTKLIRLKLGDGFRFFIAHEQRHMIQIAHVLAVLEKAAEPGISKLPGINQPVDKI
jgi:hypothetical protein